MKKLAALLLAVIAIPVFAQTHKIPTLDYFTTVTPEQYGAKGDGVTDDRAALQAAFNACSVTGCSVQLGPKTYANKSGVLDIGGGVSHSLIGYGKGSQITCSPTTTTEACIRVSNGAEHTIANLVVVGNSHITYTVEIISTGSAEDGHLENLTVNANGGSYAVAISPTAHWDIAHVNLYNVKMVGAALADMVVGDGVQSNVLDNNCFGCTFDTSAGDGVLIRGGGLSLFGSAWDSNAGTDVHVTTPADQPLVISGGRSENSAQFFLGAATITAMPITKISGISWAGSASPATYAVQANNSAPITIEDSWFISSANTVQFSFAISNQHPQVVRMENVGTSNASWGTFLSSLGSNVAIVLRSWGDYYIDPATRNVSAGSGLVFGGNPVASVSTTAATTDTVSINGVTSSGHCQLTPTNASAATNLATTYVSAKTTNQITVTHTATANMTYDILCTAY